MEIITVHEYWGNDFCGSRKAKYYPATRTIEYFPEPVYEEEFDEEKEKQVEPEDGEDEYE